MLPRSTLFPYTTLFRSEAIPAVSSAKFASGRSRKQAPYIRRRPQKDQFDPWASRFPARPNRNRASRKSRSEEHTSEFQSPDHLVCRLLLEKKKKRKTTV